NLWFGTFTGGVSKYDGNSFTNYTTSQGLTSNAINSIIEDKVGNMWFGTDEGVNKFDGTTFSAFGKFKKINSLLEDSAGNFWFGTEGNGMYRYAGDSIIVYSKSDGLSGNNVYVIKEDQKGIFWIGTENGLCNYNGKEFRNITLNIEKVTTICIDKSGNIWAGNNYGYIQYDGADTTNYSFGEEIVPFVYEDHIGKIWFSIGREGKLAIYNGKSFSYLDKSNGLLYGDIHTITEDQSGNIWFGTEGHGIVKYSGTAFQRLTNNSIRSIFEDHDGDLWFSGYGGAITKFDGEYFTDYKLNIPFWSIFQDRSGIIWMGSEGNGLIKFDQASFTFYTDVNGLADNSIMCILQDSKGNLWIGTRKGVSKFDGKSFINFTKSQGLAGDYVSCILEDKPGEFWIGTEGGLSFYDGKSFTNYSMSSELIGNNIKSLVKDKDDHLWIGTYGGGLTRYDGKSFYTYTTEQGLPDNVVTQVALTKEGYIIAGTNNGIALLTGFRSDTLSETYRPNQYTENKLFPAQNSLHNEDLAHHSPVFEIFNSKTGYPVKDVNRGQNTIFQDHKGILWIATGSEKSGLTRFDYSALDDNSTPPLLNITSIHVDNELICWNDLLNHSTYYQKSGIQVDTIVSPASVTEEVTTFGKV
ncbi:MAG: two-component regulator propeller domain-containing protein, partial [Saprospiraceae bacterium]